MGPSASFQGHPIKFFDKNLLVCLGQNKKLTDQYGALITAVIS